VSLCRRSTVSYVRRIKLDFTLPHRAPCFLHPQVVGGCVSLPFVSTPHLSSPLDNTLPFPLYLCSPRGNTSPLISAIPLLSSRHQHLFSPILSCPILSGRPPPPSPLGNTAPLSGQYLSSPVGNTIHPPPLLAAPSCLCYAFGDTIPPSPHFFLWDAPVIRSYRWYLSFPPGNTLPPFISSPFGQTPVIRSYW